MTNYTQTLTDDLSIDDNLSIIFPYVVVTNSVRSSISTLLRFLRKPVKYLTIELPPVHGYLEPGDTIWTNHTLIPEVEPYDGSVWKLVPLFVVSVTDHVSPPKITLRAVDLRETYCTWWSPLQTDIGMTPDLNGIAILDRAGGWGTVRDQLAYGERPGGDDTFQEVTANTPIIDAFGLLVEGGGDTNHILNSALSEGTGNTFTSWSSTTSGSAIAVEWRLYTLIDAPGFQRACQFATYAAGESAYLSQTVNTMGGKKLYAKVYYKDGGAVDRMSIRIQRSDTSAYWRDSDSTWQGSATDNSLTPGSGVIDSVRWTSKLIDLTGITANITVAVGHFSAAYGSAQISQLQGVELVEAPSTEPFFKWRNPLPTKAVAVTRVVNITGIVNDTAVRVLSPTRGFFKVDYEPEYNHADLIDGRNKYIWAADFDESGNAEWLRCYYHRATSVGGQWRFAIPDSGVYATLDVAGADMMTRGTTYTIICRWTSVAQDEHGMAGQALDIWVNGVKGTAVSGYAEQSANSECTVYLGGSPNLNSENEFADGHLRNLTIDIRCPPDDELLRL